MTRKKATQFSTDRLSALSVGNHFKQPELLNELLARSRSSRYRDAVWLQLHSGEACIFDYGVVVFWGTKEIERNEVLEQIHPFIEQPAIKYEAENFRFIINADRNGFSQDTIMLQSDEPLHRLAVSHAIAQSIKLNIFEDQAQRTIQETAHIPRSLALTGHTTLSRRKTAQMRGFLFSTKSDIILNYGLLDTPDFFWEYPELQSLYEPVARYLEIRPRITLLSNKLETIRDLFEMLADEQKHQHSSRLEWIIIILIAIEIVYFAFHG